MAIRRLKLLSSVTLTVFVAAACATSPTGEDMSVEAARQFAEMKASLPLLTDRAMIDYIACIANAVVDVLEPPYSDLDWEMAIFEVDAINAFAMPGGKIGVMTGILKAAQNQHQLAAVIGHEIAHVTANHSNERALRSSVSNVGIQVVAVLLGGATDNRRTRRRGCRDRRRPGPSRRARTGPRRPPASPRRGRRKVRTLLLSWLAGLPPAPQENGARIPSAMVTRMA